MSDTSLEAFQAKHASVSFISKKTEKIVTAIYMVTDFIAESEPLRIELRTVALSLMSQTRLLLARSTDMESSLADEVLRAIDDAITLLSLATTIGLVSHMNGSILRAELTRNETELRRLYLPHVSDTTPRPDYSSVVLTPDFFEVEAPSAPRLSVYREQPRPAAAANVLNGHAPTRAAVFERKPQEAKPVEPNRDVPAKNSSVGLKIARRSDVLSVVRSRGMASIRDITSVIKDMSEKTVQRELLALVKEGVLVKEGEKRWSTYRIAA